MKAYHVPVWYRYTIQDHEREEWHYEKIFLNKNEFDFKTLGVVKRYRRNGNWHIFSSTVPNLKGSFKSLNKAMIAVEIALGRDDRN